MKLVEAPEFIELILQIIVSNDMLYLLLRGKKSFLEKNDKIFIPIDSAKNVDRYQ